MSIKFNCVNKYKGHILVEVLLAMSLFVVIATAVLGGFISVRDGKVAQKQALVAKGYLDQAVEALRSVRERDWVLVSVNGIYHPNLNGSTWELLPNQGPEIDGFRTQIVIADILRSSTDPFGNVVPAGDIIDPASKKATITVSWGLLSRQKAELEYYLGRSARNDVSLQTSVSDFESGNNSGTHVVNNQGGEVILANNTHARWCSPSLHSSAIDLPDGPPVAVAARASSVSNSIPNDVLVATAPEADNSIKLAYVDVTADADTPTPTLRGKFTLNPSEYSAPGYVPTGINLDNNFKTNDVEYYTSSGSANTGFLNPSANSIDSGGDGNGFQTNPTNAYTDNSSFAVDTNSGNDTTTGCTDVGKDKHRFYNYNVSVPSGNTVVGIEVRLDARVDNTSGSPKMCVQLSWDGGITWTSTKSTPNLSNSEASYSLGGLADTWGHSWSDSDFSNANFRLRVIDVSSNTSRDFSLDWAAVKVHYSSGIGKTYALLTTNMPDKEVIAVLVNDGDPGNDNGTSGEYADPVNKIFKYWTYFNTRIYRGVSSSSNDQSPYGYGASALKIFDNKGYILSGGFLYVFDLSDIDSRSPTNELAQIGCRIRVGDSDGKGADCKPGTPNGSWAKYNNGQTGTSYGLTGIPSHNTCADGGNIALFADEALDVARVASDSNKIYTFIAIGGISNNELAVVKTNSVPSNLSSVTCGVTDGTDWKQVGQLDFNSTGGEEAANSVFAKSDGSRVYMTSNGGVDSNQFYIIKTSTPSSPSFIKTVGSLPTQGYYNGNNVANAELHPRRSLTVLNGDRAVLVGKDVDSPTPNDAQEYQVLNTEDETGAPLPYCGGVNFDSGFNDLVSVVEADSDSFVYMVANTQEKQLKIIQGGEDGTYVPTGIFESEVFDAGPNKTVMFNRVDADVSVPSGTALNFQIVTYGDGTQACNDITAPAYYGPGRTTDVADFFTVGGPIPYHNLPSTNINPARCFKYKVSLYSDTSRDKTPTLNSMEVNYSP